MDTKLQNLGRLEKVDLRDIWESEATDFTPWLAREDNLALLGEAIDIDLELEAQEQSVGPFRADILCKDVINDHWVLIENQLEKTDHKHLGQLLTYAAGLQAVTIIWIADRFTEEHRATLDWLNDITDERFNFFGLEIELWRIGNSPIAPKFNVISKPNNWSKTVVQGAKRLEEGSLTETKQLQYQFWVELGEFLGQQKATFQIRKPAASNWNVVTLGRSGFRLYPVLNTRPKEIRIDLYITHKQSKACFKALEQDKEAIEKELGMPLNWRLLPDNKASIIELHEPRFDPMDQTQWPSMKAWFYEYVGKMTTAFADRIKQLDPEEWVEETEEQFVG